jgi:chromosome segregation ATPase
MMILLLHGATALAAPKQESAGQQAFKKAQGVVRQLTEEKQALETEKTGLLEQVKKLESIVKQLEPLQGEVQLHKTQAETLRSSNGTLATQLLGEREKQQNLQRKIKEIVAEAKLIQNDNQLLVTAIAERERWIKQCADKNRQLVEANQALVGKYQDKGFWDKLAEIEPFTGIGKVESQTTAETYQFKLEDLKVTDFASETDALRQEKAK